MESKKFNIVEANSNPKLMNSNDFACLMQSGTLDHLIKESFEDEIENMILNQLAQ